MFSHRVIKQLSNTTMIRVFTAQWAQNSSLVFHYFSPSRRGSRGGPPIPQQSPTPHVCFQNYPGDQPPEVSKSSFPSALHLLSSRARPHFGPLLSSPGSPFFIQLFYSILCPLLPWPSWLLCQQPALFLGLSSFSFFQNVLSYLLWYHKRSGGKLIIPR